MTRPGKWRTTIRLTVVTVFIVATTTTAAVAIGLQYYFGQAMARESAARLYSASAGSIAVQLRALGAVDANVIDLLAENQALVNPAQEQAQLQIFSRVLEKNPLYYGVYLGRGDDSFMELINLESSEDARVQLQAEAADRWLVISLRDTPEGSQRHYRYLDSDLNTRRERSETSSFRPTERAWYRSALASGEVEVSPPYLFAQLGVPGRTISRRIDGSDTVVAIDSTLAILSTYLSGLDLAGEADIYLYDRRGQVLGASTASPQQEQATTVPALLVTLAQRPDRQGTVGLSTINDSKTITFTTAVSADDDQPIYIGILAPLARLEAPFLERVKFSIAITAGVLLLLLPLSWLFASPIVGPVRQLAAENDKVRLRQYDSVERVRSHVKELDELSESMVNMVAAIRAHELAQRELMDAFIRLIAQAIDEKSPYTGGHCARVPELALMLAEKASASQAPAFKEFRLTSEDQWREYRIAAWLHDCGKITTPEHIVDKGSKLETIYNRLHEVRMRFEVLWRDAQIDYLQRRLAGAADDTGLQSALARRQQQLRDDYAFVAACNIGGEFLDEAHGERLQRIAQQTWMRHFDDRIGLSPVEALRLSDSPAPLPAQEFLLADKPEHRIQRTRSTDYPPELGIDMEIPELLYNQGELYNLSVSRGTLTEEDRFRIKEHMISTIRMLESLPFPPELGNVPRYASTHHETMSGSGYPRKLPGRELTIPERILAVADVFEALTASDRPYKMAKPVSVAIDILHDMVLDDHIDRDCFELFLREGVYLEYARRFLQQEQLDGVDVQRYLSA